MSHVECNKTGIRSYRANTGRPTVAGIRELELDSVLRSDMSSEKTLEISIWWKDKEGGVDGCLEVRFNEKQQI
ncbi:hypothetical protein V1478_011079 [Vespula squamosa]|uniref:Uncharacterized protein n=1 Tax=Vespula squamosa TaxID=30214 RepID=A0ABD2AH78_VESSQ